MNHTQLCPWDGFAPGTISFCERQLCAWITTPANTWSNLAYIFVGIYVLYLACRENYRSLSPIGVIGILVGIGSFFFHASSTFIGEFFDLLAMFLFAAFMLVFNIWRIKGGSLKILQGMYVVIVMLSASLLLLVRPAGVGLFTVIITAALVVELKIFIRSRNSIDYRPMLKLILCFSIAFTFWRLDITGRLCDPDNHWFQGHAMWHIMNSFCFYFLFRFYQQFVGPRTQDN
jgi:hypothetical protein